MAMNDAEMEHVVSALQSWIGAPVGRAYQPTRDRVLLEMGQRTLLMVPRGPHARLHSVGRRPKNPQKPFSFQGALRAHLSGRLTAVDKDADDRVVVLTIGQHQLVLRLTGRRGGLWLVQRGQVIAAYDGPAPTSLPPLQVFSVAAKPARFSPRADEDWDRSAARYFGDLERADRRRQRKIQLGKRLRTEIGKHQRLCTNLERDLKRASDAPKLRRQADALAAILHTLSRGTTTAIAQDFEDPDRTWSIAIDPTHPPAHTLQRLYKKAGRMDRSGDQILDRLDHVENHLVRLTSALESIDDAGPSDFDEIAGLLPRVGARQNAKSALPWVTWTGPTGQEIWVGRNATGNRRLTFQKARGNDWWMHLRERPGAHIVLRMKRDQTPSLSLLLVAGQIAAIHAKIAFESSIDVQYTRVKNVRSIPGDSGGRVRLSDERVLRITRTRNALDGWFTDAALVHGLPARTE